MFIEEFVRTFFKVYGKEYTALQIEPTKMINLGLNSDRSSDKVTLYSESGVREREVELKRDMRHLLQELLIEIEREASYYISTMNGLIEGGKYFIGGTFCYNTQLQFSLLFSLLV